MRLPRDVSGAELAKRPNRLGYRITRRLNAGQIRDARRRIALTDFQNDGVLMKNRQYELRRRLARQYHRNTRGDSFEQDILLRHDYGEVDPNGLSWWDDVMFVLGKVRINVAWRHPRQGYHDLIVDAAMEATRHLQEKIEGDMFDGAEKSFKKLGRSRKKVMSYTLTDRSGAREWFDALRAEEARLGAEADFAVSPSVKIEMLGNV